MTPRQIEKATNRLAALRQKATDAFFAGNVAGHRQISRDADVLADQIAAGYRASTYWSPDIRDQLLASLQVTRKGA